MLIVTVDVESFYSTEYSLRRMTPAEYILDPRWETIGWAVKEGDGASVWMEDAEFRHYLGGLPDDVAMVSHNALFDMCVLAWRYGYVPRLMIDTLGMARAWYNYRFRSLALASLAAGLGLGQKGTTVHKVQGMSLAAIKAAGFHQEYTEYGCHDADLCRMIFDKIMREGFPVQELSVLDTVLRCAVLPQFLIDPHLLAEHLHLTRASKQSLLDRLELQHADSFGDKTTIRDVLMSNDMFATALRALGVEPPMKISPVTGKEAYAFAKTDADFIELEEHPDPEVQALVSARLGVKSTIEETRTERFIGISRLRWPSQQQCWMPIPLKYSGAHTHRFSGDWKMNLQNLPRGGTIRKALTAPEGRVVVAVDASQIEARLAGWFCGATDLVRAFANKEDVYSSFATKLFNYEVNKQTHPVERFIGKTSILGLQYGLGWVKFQDTVARQSKAQVGQEVVLIDEQAQQAVMTYRQTYHQVPAMWRYLNSLIAHMTSKDCCIDVGPVRFEYERVRLPSGLFLYYHNLQNEDGQWWFTHSGKKKYLYGGKLFENIVQALARICIMNAEERLRKRFTAEIGASIRLALQVHDELVFVPKKEHAEAVLAMAIEEVSRPPVWGPDIPLDAEGSTGLSYGECK